jgi:hypothetical protein
MRLIAAFPFAAAIAALAACSVENDSANDQMTLEYNQQRMEAAARATARTARDVGAAAGNVAASTGRAIGNEVGDIDVDVDVTRNRSVGAGNSAAER